MRSPDDLKATLRRIDGRGYKSYRDIRGQYAFETFTLAIDYVQGDPFAAPSRVRVIMPQSVAGYPAETFRGEGRRVALTHYLAQEFATEAQRFSRPIGTGGGGRIEIDRPGQEMLARTSCSINEKALEVRFTVGLPAAGRKVLGHQAVRILCDHIPDLVKRAMPYAVHHSEDIAEQVETGEDARFLRGWLREEGLVAFVADESVLPRRSGVDERPMEEGAVPFRAPEALAREVVLPNYGKVRGMAIPEGITLIVGGGFHGKSSLLNAIERGIYDHEPGDGRELVITREDAVKIRAEDGRSVVGVDISPFIGALPGRRETQAFTSANASGSTSQAANIIEALALGSRLLLMDEDTCATNFLIRDHRMQALIASDKEPITPYLDRAQTLRDKHGVSTILVLGGSGDYLDVADTVIGMEDYLPRDLTGAAKEVIAKFPSQRRDESKPARFMGPGRVVDARSMDPSKGKRDVKVRAVERKILFGCDEIDLSAIAQIVDRSQARAMAEALVLLKRRYLKPEVSLSEAVDALLADIETEGLDIVSPTARGDLAEFRVYELGAALNRLRSMKLVSEQ